MRDQLALRFERERETKNTIRYQELAEDGEHVVGSLYVRKAELARLGDPSRADGDRSRHERGHQRHRRGVKPYRPVRRQPRV